MEESLRLQIFELQAQMRPHFIFNVINSIQGFILNEDVDTSLHYLSLLSKLIRKTLENADRELVPIAEEVEIIMNFLEIERMRFDGALDYNLEIDPGVDLQSTFIPPMILQPYIDMSLRQGIRHRDQGGVMNISIDSNQDHILTVTITDNGPGWKTLIFSTPPPPEPGLNAYKLLSDRIKLLNKLNNTDAFSVLIEDLLDENNKATGTSIVIRYLLTEG